MPLPLTLTPTGQQLAVPTSWADCTLQQFIALAAPDGDDQRTAAEVLLNLEAGALGQLPIAEAAIIAPLLDFAQDLSPVLQAAAPSGLPDVGTLPWHCLLECQERFHAEPEAPALRHLPFVLATYRCQLLYNSTSRVAEVEAAVLASPVTEVYAEGAYFLKGSRTWLNGTAPSPTTKPITTRKSWMPASWHWLKNLGLPSAWTR